ncbi:hypothetical protein AWC38_SpisGene13542 [Stylophora pistillata]|uniref:Uncharacterized protein n=1 Tax=Stylophora pistillata TaxID=50429 RepID=A0A2B4S052_STYPI|nr:hypothetical protein AWC38_SpisGene13542 [Stylophora pistillata]
MGPCMVLYARESLMHRVLRDRSFFTREGRNVDDWQPRVELKKEYGSGSLVLSDSESVAAFSDEVIVKPKFVVQYLTHLDMVDFKKEKRAKKRAKECEKAKEKNYEDYAWKDLCEDPRKLKKLRVPELNIYLKHHRQDKYPKSTKNDKVKVITRHWPLQMNPEGTDLLQTRMGERDEAENEPLLDSDNDGSGEDDNSGPEAEVTVMRRMKLITLTLVIDTNQVMSFLPSSMTKKLRGQPQHVREEP